VAAGACPIVISPTIVPGLTTLLAEGRIEYWPRKYQPEDMVGAFLVIVATDNSALNTRICKAARQQGALVNVVDDPHLCNFYAPSVVRRGNFVISISTGGAAPALAAHIRQELEAQYGSEYEAFVAWCAAVRSAVVDDHPDPVERRARWYELVDSPVLSLMAEGSLSEAHAWVSRIMGDRIVGLPLIADRDLPHGRS
ncbi:MAG: bifunctional precorrin-2 dehydrogenase/sirohydrochlorin ferrochelatase, partial [Anaerolineales bacterium]